MSTSVATITAAWTRGDALAKQLAALCGVPPEGVRQQSRVVRCDDPSYAEVALPLADTAMTGAIPSAPWTWILEGAVDVDELCVSLSQTLSAFPVVAGRIRRAPRADDPPAPAPGEAAPPPLPLRGRADMVVCCNAGVPVTSIRVGSGLPPSWRSAIRSTLTDASDPTAGFGSNTLLSPPFPSVWQGPPSLRACRRNPGQALLEVDVVQFISGGNEAVDHHTPGSSSRHRLARRGGSKGSGGSSGGGWKRGGGGAGSSVASEAGQVETTTLITLRTCHGLQDGSGRAAFARAWSERHVANGEAAAAVAAAEAAAAAAAAATAAGAPPADTFVVHPPVHAYTPPRPVLDRSKTDARLRGPPVPPPPAHHRRPHAVSPATAGDALQSEEEAAEGEAAGPPASPASTTGAASTLTHPPGGGGVAACCGSGGGGARKSVASSTSAACEPAHGPAARPLGWRRGDSPFGSLCREAAFPVGALRLSFAIIRAAFNPGMGLLPSAQKAKGVTLASFSFSPARLAALKAAASAPREGGVSTGGGSGKVSTFDALAAAVWAAVASSRLRRGAFDAGVAAPVQRLWLVANLRERVGLSPDYYGNCLGGIAVDAPLSTLSQPGNIAAVAAAINARKAAATSAEAIHAEFGYIEAAAHSSRKVATAVRFYEGGLFLTDWRFPAAPLTAAHWGLPVLGFVPSLGSKAPFGFGVPYLGALAPAVGPGAQPGGVTLFLVLPVDEVAAVKAKLDATAT